MYAVSPAGSVSIFPFGSQIGRQGENITLTCATQGGPNNSFVWEQNGQVLVGENENQLTVMIKSKFKIIVQCCSYKLGLISLADSNSNSD